MLEAALLFLVFFGPLAFGCVETWSLAILQAVLFSLPLLAARKSSLAAGPPPRPLLAGIGVLLLVGVVQAFNPVALDEPSSWLPFTASAWQTKKAILLWSAYGALVWGASVGFREPRVIRRFSWAVVLIGFAIAVIGLIQAADGNKFVLGFREVGYGRSPFGPYYNNAHAASLLAVSALMGFGLFGSRIARLYGRRYEGESRADALAIQALVAFSIAVVLLGLYATRNRGSVLAFGVASLIVGLLSCGWIKKPAARWGARAAIVVVFACAAAATVHLGLIRRGAQTSIPVRLSMYRGGAKLLADFPLWGAGLGTVISVFPPYKEAQVDGIVDHVHSDWLELPMQAGLPAAALVLAAVVVYGSRVYSAWMREASLERRFVMGGGIAAALCFLLHAVVEFTWQIPANAVIFLLILCWLWSQAASPGPRLGAER